VHVTTHYFTILRRSDMARVLHEITHIQFYLPANTSHTCLYYPAADHHRLLAGIHFADPRRVGQTEFTWVASYIPREFNCNRVTHSDTNRTRRTVTSLIGQHYFHYTPNDRQVGLLRVLWHRSNINASNFRSDKNNAKYTCATVD